MAYAEITDIRTGVVNTNSTSTVIPVDFPFYKNDAIYVLIVKDGTGTFTVPAGWSTVQNGGYSAQCLGVFVYKEETNSVSTVTSVTFTHASECTAWILFRVPFYSGRGAFSNYGFSSTPQSGEYTSSYTVENVCLSVVGWDYNRSLVSYPSNMPDNRTSIVNNNTGGVGIAMATTKNLNPGFAPNAFTISAADTWNGCTVFIALQFPSYGGGQYRSWSGGQTTFPAPSKTNPNNASLLAINGNRIDTFTPPPGFTKIKTILVGESDTMYNTKSEYYYKKEGIQASENLTVSTTGNYASCMFWALGSVRDPSTIHFQDPAEYISDPSGSVIVKGSNGIYRETGYNHFCIFYDYHRFNSSNVFTPTHPDFSAYSSPSTSLYGGGLTGPGAFRSWAGRFFASNGVVSDIPYTTSDSTVGNTVLIKIDNTEDYRLVTVSPNIAESTADTNYHRASEVGGFSGGLGTSVSPYQLGTKNDLFKLTKQTIDFDKYFIITQDIDMESTNFLGIGNYIDEFSGHIDGQGHKIKNLYCNWAATDVGFIKVLSGSGEIKNIIFEDSHVIGTTYNTAVVAGLATNIVNVTIHNVKVIGAVLEGNWATGGIVGTVYRVDINAFITISSCSFRGSLNMSGGRGGGICGDFDGPGNIIDCVSDVELILTSSGDKFRYGAICGRAYDLDLTSNCVGKVTVSSNNAPGAVANTCGGLFGQASASMFCKIEKSVGILEVNEPSGYNFGALCGYITDVYVEKCYGYINSTAGSYVGGLAGWTEGETGNIAKDICIEGSVHISGIPTNRPSYGGITSEVYISPIENCLTMIEYTSSPAVTDNSYVDGVIGWWGSISGDFMTQCYYSTTNAPTIPQWSGGGTYTGGGKTNAELLYPPDVSLYGGWDFVNTWYWTGLVGSTPKLYGANAVFADELVATAISDAPQIITAIDNTVYSVIALSQAVFLAPDSSGGAKVIATQSLSTASSGSHDAKANANITTDMLFAYTGGYVSQVTGEGFVYPMPVSAVSSVISPSVFSDKSVQSVIAQSLAETIGPVYGGTAVVSYPQALLTSYAIVPSLTSHSNVLATNAVANANNDSPSLLTESSITVSIIPSVAEMNQPGTSVMESITTPGPIISATASALQSTLLNDQIFTVTYGVANASVITPIASLSRAVASESCVSIAESLYHSITRTATVFATPIIANSSAAQPDILFSNTIESEQASSNGSALIPLLRFPTYVNVPTMNAIAYGNTNDLILDSILQVVYSTSFAYGQEHSISLSATVNSVIPTALFDSYVPVLSIGRIIVVGELSALADVFGTGYVLSNNVLPGEGSSIAEFDAEVLIDGWGPDTLDSALWNEDSISVSGWVVDTKQEADWTSTVDVEAVWIVDGKENNVWEE